MKLDLHVHSNASADSNIKPKTLLKKAKELGIGFAITDHSNTGSWKELKELNKQFKVPLIFGEEIKVLDDSEEICGELTGLFMLGEVRVRHYSVVLDDLKAQNALITAPHPFDFRRDAFKHLKQELKRIDCLEVFNARCITQEPNRQALKFAQENSKAFTAGSDAHVIEEFGKAGLELEFSSLEEARKKILAKQCKVFGSLSGITPHLKTQLIKYNFLKDF